MRRRGLGPSGASQGFFTGCNGARYLLTGRNSLLVCWVFRLVTGVFAALCTLSVTWLILSSTSETVSLVVLDLRLPPPPLTAAVTGGYLALNSCCQLAWACSSCWA